MARHVSKPLSRSGFWHSFSTHERIVLHPKPPRLVFPVLRIVNSNWRSARHLPSPHRKSFFDPDAITDHIGLVQSAINSHGDAKTTGSAGQFLFPSTISAPAHD